MQELVSALELMKKFGGPTTGEILDSHVQAINAQSRVIDQQATQIQTMKVEIRTLQARADLARQGHVVNVGGALALLALIVWSIVSLRQMDQRVKRLEIARQTIR